MYEYLNAYILSNDFLIFLGAPDVKWSEVSYGEVLGDKIAMYNRVTLCWGYSNILWLFHFGISCTMFVLTCILVVLTCFVVCGCVCMCGCFGNMYTCIYCVLYCLYCVFVLFRLCIFIRIFLCTSVRTTVTKWQLKWS
jgi:hypothetical protein